MRITRSHQEPPGATRRRAKEVSQVFLILVALKASASFADVLLSEVAGEITRSQLSHARTWGDVGQRVSL